jgi:hypothetical protein
MERKLPQETPTVTLINQGRNPAQSVNRENPLPRHHENRREIGKALMWGILITSVGLFLDYVVRQLRWPWLSERFLENIIEGVVFTLIIWAVREKRLQRRFKELGYLNHHVRNSLTVIEMAEGYVAEVDERLHMVNAASKRIRRCVDRISREEDCEINQQSPQEP